MKVLVSKIYYEFETETIIPNQRIFVSDNKLVSKSKKDKVCLPPHCKNEEYERLIDLDLFDVYDDLQSCKSAQCELYMRWQEIVKRATFMQFFFDKNFYPKEWQGASAEHTDSKDFERFVFKDVGIEPEEQFVRDRQITRFIYDCSREMKIPMILYYSSSTSYRGHGCKYALQNFPSPLIGPFKRSYQNEGLWSNAKLVRELERFSEERSKK